MVLSMKISTMSVTSSSSSIDDSDCWEDDISEVTVNESFEELEQSLISLLSETEDAVNESSNDLKTCIEIKAPSCTINHNVKLNNAANLQVNCNENVNYIPSKCGIVSHAKQVLKRPHFDTDPKPIVSKRCKPKNNGLSCLGKKHGLYNEDTALPLSKVENNLNSVQVCEVIDPKYQIVNQTSVEIKAPEDHNKENFVSLKKLAGNHKNKQQNKSALENIVNIIPIRGNQIRKLPAVENSVEIEVTSTLNEDSKQELQSAEKYSDFISKCGNSKLEQFTELSQAMPQESIPEVCTPQAHYNHVTALSDSGENFSDPKCLKLPKELNPSPQGHANEHAFTDKVKIETVAPSAVDCDNERDIGAKLGVQSKTKISVISLPAIKEVECEQNLCETTTYDSVFSKVPDVDHIITSKTPVSSLSEVGFNDRYGVSLSEICQHNLVTSKMCNVVDPKFSSSENEYKPAEKMSPSNILSHLNVVSRIEKKLENSSVQKFASTYETYNTDKIIQSSLSDNANSTAESSSLYECIESNTITSNTVDAFIDRDTCKSSKGRVSGKSSNSCCPTPTTVCKKCNQKLMFCSCFIDGNLVRKNSCTGNELEGSEIKPDFLLQRKFDSLLKTPQSKTSHHSSFISSTPVIHKMTLDDINCKDLSIINKDISCEEDNAIKHSSLDCNEEGNNILNKLSFECWLKSDAVEVLSQLSMSKQYEKIQECEEADNDADIDEDSDIDEELEATLMEFNLETLRDIADSEISINKSTNGGMVQAQDDYVTKCSTNNTEFRNDTFGKKTETILDKIRSESKGADLYQENPLNKEVVLYEENSDCTIVAEVRNDLKCALFDKNSAMLSNKKPDVESENCEECHPESLIKVIDLDQNRTDFEVVEVIENSVNDQITNLNDKLEISVSVDKADLEHTLIKNSDISQSQALDAEQMGKEVFSPIVVRDGVITDICPNKLDLKNSTEVNKNSQVTDCHDVKAATVSEFANHSENLNSEPCPAACNITKESETVDVRSPSKSISQTKKLSAVTEVTVVPNADVQSVETSSEVTPEEKNCKDIRQIQNVNGDDEGCILNNEKAEKNIQPVKMIFPEEHKDIEHPDWDIIRKLDTDEERYKQVRSRWMSRNIPDPNCNLTTHSFRKRRVLMEENLKHSPIRPPSNRGHKRLASANLDKQVNKRTRTKTVPCTYIIDSKIESVKKQYSMKASIARDEYYSQIQSISKQQEDLNYRMRFQQQSTHSEQYYKYPFFDSYVYAMNSSLYHMVMMQNEAEKNRLRFEHERKISEERQKCDLELNALVEARKEINKFCSFYKGLNGTDDNDPTVITELQMQELNEIENVYQQFKNHYYDPNK